MKTVKEKLQLLLEQEPNLLNEISIEELAKAIDLVHQSSGQISPKLDSKLASNGSHITINNGKKSVNTLPNNLIVNEHDSSIASNITTKNSAAIAQVQPQITQGIMVPIEPNELLPSVSIWTILGGLITAIAISVATIMATVIEYKIVVKGEAIVRPTGELRLVQASTEGAVSDIFSIINQPIKKGDIIATLDSSQLQNQKIQIETSIQQAQLQLTLIEAQINALESQIQAENDKIARSVASAKAQLESRQREYQDRLVTTVADVEEAEANLKQTEEELQEAQAKLKSAQANLGSINAALDAARSKRDRYQPIAELGALSQDKLEEARLDVQQQKQLAVAQRAIIEAQQQRIERLQQGVKAAFARSKRVQTALNPSNAVVEIASETIAHQQATGKVILATLNKERQALIQQKTVINKILFSDHSALQQSELNFKKTKIIATADGIIAKLNLRNPGQTVRVGEEIAQIVPSNSAMEIKAQIKTQDIGKVRLEQPVDIRISACPYPDYGTVSGKVSKISPDAFTSNKILPLNSANKATYEVTIIPDSLVLNQGGKECALQLGMEGRADIISDKETVWQFILRKARLSTNL